MKMKMKTWALLLLLVLSLFLIVGCDIEDTGEPEVDDEEAPDIVEDGPLPETEEPTEGDQGPLPQKP